MKNIISQIKDFHSRFGISGAFKRVVKAIARRVACITFERCYFVVCDLPKDIELKPLPDGHEFRRLMPEDIINDPDWHEQYGGGTSESLKEYFSRDYASGFGYFIDGKLAYSNWMLRGMIELPGNLLYMTPQFVTCQKSFTLPAFRRMGLHDRGTERMMLEASNEGFKGYVAVLYAYNKANILASNRQGMTNRQTFYIFSFRDKYFTNFSPLRLD